MLLSVIAMLSPIVGEPRSIASDTHEPRSTPLSLPIVMSLVATTSCCHAINTEEIFLSVYLLAFNQSKNAGHQKIFCFVLNYVPADSGSRCRQRYASVTMPEDGMCCLWCLCCKRSDTGFELNLDVEMLLLVDA